MKINGEQTVKLRSGSIKSKNHLKQITVTFKIYVDFECNLEKIHTNKRANYTFYTKTYQDNISNSFAYKRLYVLVIILVNQLFFTEVNM